MPCTKPLDAWRGQPTSNGKRPIVFQAKDAPPPASFFPLKLPCGQCINCRLERSRQWAVRCMHEASLYENNAFVTLTYDEQHVPLNGSLDVTELQGYMKRLRKHEKKKFGSSLVVSMAKNYCVLTFTYASLIMTMRIKLCGK